jgi:hypothetical protein
MWSFGALIFMLGVLLVAVGVAMGLRDVRRQRIPATHA